tara:strand:- start:711 stop:1370 length:660 start_codon:yes stop_codon:yes gene_type:complete
MNSEKRNLKIVVYTALKGKKDEYRDDILCFTDYDRFKSNRMNSKIFKILPHLFFDADYSIWVDCNIFLKVASEDLINLLGEKNIAVVRHPNNNCIYDEAKVVIKAKLDDPEVVNEQINRYKRNGYKKNQGMGMCGIIVRKHTERIGRLNEKWWAEICRGSSRDQISFNYVFKQDIRYIDWPGSYNNNLFFRPNHKVLYKTIKTYFTNPINKYIIKPISK